MFSRIFRRIFVRTGVPDAVSVLHAALKTAYEDQDRRVEEAVATAVGELRANAKELGVALGVCGLGRDSAERRLRESDQLAVSHELACLKRERKMLLQELETTRDAVVDLKQECILLAEARDAARQELKESCKLVRDLTDQLETTRETVVSLKQDCDILRRERDIARKPPPPAMDVAKKPRKKSKSK